METDTNEPPGICVIKKKKLSSLKQNEKYPQI